MRARKEAAVNRGKGFKPAAGGRFRRSWSAGRRRASGQASQPFQPSPYLSSLIASVNDGAKAAQTGALFFAFIGLYLLAAAFSTTDEDLLRERTVAVAQLGMAVPVVFSFAVAPLIFLFLHIHTLIRYDMLAANLRQFERELTAIPREEDRERCRHLLANVEFLRQLGASPGTHLASRLFRIVSWFMIAFFPVLVLLIIQLSALRYQDGGIVFAHRGSPSSPTSASSSGSSTASGGCARRAPLSAVGAPEPTSAALCSGSDRSSPSTSPTWACRGRGRPSLAWMHLSGL
jgi:hypothetical protein